MTTKGKLELTWVGKENRPRLEPRILEEDVTLSSGDRAAENMLIHGDNLLTLKPWPPAKKPFHLRPVGRSCRRFGDHRVNGIASNRIPNVLVREHAASLFRVGLCRGV
jgi:hypothetical protein